MSTFHSRAVLLTELMDDAQADEHLLTQTYAAFDILNRLLSRWSYLFTHELLPRFNQRKELIILDVGCGGGDVLMHLQSLFLKHGIEVQAIGVDSDIRAIQFAQQTYPGKAFWLNTSLKQFALKCIRPDIIISNHVLHHLDDRTCVELCRDMLHLEPQFVLLNDIERSRLGYALFATFAGICFPNTFIRTDGLRSIRRSFTQQELQAILPDWKVSRVFPFRLTASYERH